MSSFSEQICLCIVWHIGLAHSTIIMSSCQYQQLEQQEQDRFQTKGAHPQYHPHDSLDKIVPLGPVFLNRWAADLLLVDRQTFLIHLDKFITIN